MTRDDDSAEVRRRSLRAPAADPTEQVERWLGALGDPDWRVRQEAVELLAAEAPTESLLEVLVADVAQRENVGLRNAALEVLAGLGAPAVARLRRALAECAGGERKFYAEALGEAGDPSAADDLAALARDDDPNVASAALDALVRLGGSVAERELRHRLGSDDAFHRVSALDGLARIGARLSWRELAPLLEDRVTRRAALPLLGRSGDLAAVAPLSQGLGDSPHSARSALGSLAELAEELGVVPVAEAMERSGARETLRAALGRTLADGDRDTRRRATSVAFMVRELLGPALDAAAEDVLAPVAAEALREWGADAVLPLLEASRACVASGAALAIELAAELSTLAAPDSAVRQVLHDALLEGASASSPDLVVAALRGLVVHARAEDAPQLVAISQRPSEVEAAAACEALAGLAERDADATRAALADVDVERASPAMLQLLARLRGDESIGVLRAAISAEAPALRAAAVEALGTLDDARVVDDLALALADEDDRVCLAAVEGLARIGGESAAAVLLQAIEGSSVAVQAEAARALGAIGHAPAAVRLRDLLEGSPAVASAAIEALGRIVRVAPEPSAALGDALAADIARAQAHEDPEVTRAAALAASALPPALAVARWRRALESESWHVRQVAVRGLTGLLGGPADDDARALLGDAASGERDPMVLEAIEDAFAGERRGAR
ncbi:MAG: HEAT repeat domain-containing protein [Myxococcales bacterium]|nr:HEAT repeat domain-containing protein [Myxococcales bacterium]